MEGRSQGHAAKGMRDQRRRPSRPRAASLLTIPAIPLAAKRAPLGSHFAQVSPDGT